MSTSTMTQEEFANLSDDDIMNMAEPPKMVGSEDPADGGDVDAGDQDQGDADEVVTAEEESDQDSGNADDDDSDDAADSDGAGDGEDKQEEDPAGDDEDEEEEDEPSGSKTKSDPKVPTGKKTGKAPTDDKGEEDVKPAAEAVDYKAVYEKIMAPFKANGKEIKLENPDEAIRLMQMGANYTKKLQALQPNMKLLKMLENNNLLEESKLSFLIDLEKKNPAAIQKLVKDAGIDPMDIDTGSESTYKPSSHAVSDAEFRFTDTIKEVASDPVGKSLIIDINKTWDDSSKQALWEDPDLLPILREQRENGVFDKISGEITKRQTLGTLSLNEPFIHAYLKVGKEMDAKGLLVPATASAQATSPGQPSQNKVLETRTARRTKVTNSDKARAASPVRTSGSKTVSQDFNPLAMSDEEFEKNTALANKL